jgi:hypothetical protein
METNVARGRFGLMRPLRQRIAVTSFDGALPGETGHSARRGDGDGFVPVLVAAALIASAVLLALE